MRQSHILNSVGVAVMLALMAACGSGGGAPLPEGPPPLPPGTLAAATVGPAGGVLEVTDPTSPHMGLRLEIPADALTTTESVEIRENTDPLVSGSPNAYAILPDGLTFDAPALLTLPYNESHLLLFGDAGPGDLATISRSTVRGAEILPPLSIDPATHQITCEVSHFSLFEVCSAAAWRLFVQPRFIDVGHVETSIPSGWVVSGEDSAPTPTGARLAFWSSDTALILVHGLNEDGAAFDGTDDLRNGLAPYFDKVATYQYRSAERVAESGNWLYEEVRRYAQAGFRCWIVGYSEGGLVARHAVEKSPGEVGGPPIDQYVEGIVTLATPHEGSPLVALIPAFFPVPFNLLSEALATTLVPSLADLKSGIGPATNYGPVPYQLVGSDGDSVVPAYSSNGLSDVPANRKHMIISSGHVTLHGTAATNGVLEFFRRIMANPEGRIAWATYDASGNQDIWVMDPDGSSKQRITTDPDYDYTPTISPDGRYIAFTSRRGGPNFRLWVQDLDKLGTAGPTLLAGVTALNCQSPYWTADGKEIYFSALAGASSGGLYHVNVDTKVVTNLTVAYDGRPHLDPTERYVLFDHRTSSLSYTPQLYRLDLNTSVVDTCTSVTIPSEQNAVISGGYSADGMRIAMAWGHRIVVGDTDCPFNWSTSTMLFSGVYPDIAYRNPEWSPTGRRLVFDFVDNTVTTPNRDVYVCDEDGSDLLRLTTNALTDVTPTWGPSRLLPYLVP